VDLVRAYSNPSDLSDQVEHLRSLLDLPRAARPERRQRPQKQVQRRLSDEEIAQLVAAHWAGIGVKELAVQFGVHRDTVHNILTREAALRRRGVQPDDLPEVIRLYQHGWALARLAARFEVSPSAVTNALRRAGVPIRRPGRPPTSV
jgi:lambda repressor-like predicted transcriptional regulator